LNTFLATTFWSGLGLFCKNHPGILLVIIGVAGEIACEWNKEKGTRGRRIKAFGILLVTGLVLEIWEAVKSDEQVAKMTEQNLVLEKQLKEQAAERAAVARRIDAAEASTKPRSMSPEQKEKITGRLQAIAERQKIFISASVLDAEALGFAEEIESIFVTAGFEVYLPKQIQGDVPLMVGPPGLHIVVKDPKSPFPMAAKIQRSFIDSGVEMPGLTSGDSHFETNRIEICVGQR